MKKNLKCRCLICKIECILFASLNEPPGSELFASFVRNVPSLSGFVTISALLDHLHAEHDGNAFSSDVGEILQAVIRARSTSSDPQLIQSVLLLAFTPTIHRTYREVRICFPELDRHDIAQQIFTFCLELVSAEDVEALHDFLPIAVARTLRKNMFRWAEKESRLLAGKSLDKAGKARNQEAAMEDNFENFTVLHDFLDHCCGRGILSAFERDLLLKLKIDGFNAKEIEDRHTVLSERAVLLRIHRIMQRLQDAATALSTKTQEAEKPVKPDTFSPQKKNHAIMKHFSLKHFAEFLPISN